MKKLASGLLLVFLYVSTFGQSVYVPLNKDYYHLLDRYEILNGGQSPSFFTAVKPYERKAVAQFLDSLSIDSSRLSNADRFNLQYLANDNWEWTNAASSNSKKPVLKHFYRKKSDLYSVHTQDFDLHVNPVACFQYGKENASAEKQFINTRGLELRGMIDQKIGFYIFAADNQAGFPNYVQNYVKEHNTSGAVVVPGEGYTKRFKNSTAYDFLTARGYITFNITKSIHLQFGHDKNFIGNGYRSLILSDFSSNYTFLKINAKIWKLNYMNLFTEMMADVYPSDQRFPKKYMSMHHLSINIGKSLNVGLFESVVFGNRDTLRNGQFKISYLNPVIFFLSAEQQLGSADNTLIGMDYKWNFLRHFSFYGQIVLDEFVLHQVKSGKGWWGNKQALQAGMKYMNAFGVKNLDLQGEINIVRPYTYSHINHYTSYAHYNQPLAHPLGANFYELIGIARYQPLKRLNLTGKLFYTIYGADSNATNINVGYNYGSNPLKSYFDVAQKNTFGNKITQGIRTQLLFLNLTATYQVRHNLFVDLTQIVRVQQSALKSQDLKTMVTTLGLRWNIPQRLQEF